MADETWDDFIKEAEDNYNLPAEGDYDFVVIEAEGKTSKSGNPMVRVKAKIESGPEAGKTIKDFYVIRMTSQLKKFMQHMKAMGIDFDTLAKHKPTMQQLAAAMVGKRFRGEVEHTSDARFGDAAELRWAMRPPEGGAEPVISFPELSGSESLGYGSDSGASVPTTDDAGF